MATIVTQTYTIPRTQQKLAQQLAQVTAAANRLNVGEIALFGLSAPVVSSVTPSGNTIIAVITMTGGANFENQFKTLVAKQSAVASLWTQRNNTLLTQSGTTLSTAFTLSPGEAWLNRILRPRRM